MSWQRNDWQCKECGEWDYCEYSEQHKCIVYPPLKKGDTFYYISAQGIGIYQGIVSSVENKLVWLQNGGVVNVANCFHDKERAVLEAYKRIDKAAKGYKDDIRTQANKLY